MVVAALALLQYEGKLRAGVSRRMERARELTSLKVWLRVGEA